MNNSNNNTQTICILILIIFVGLGIYLIYPKANEAIANYTAVTTKTATVASLEQQIEGIKKQKADYENEIKVSTKPVYKTDNQDADPMAAFGVMFEDVTQSAKYNGLRLKSIEYKQNPANDVVTKNVGLEYNVCGLTMELIGNYSQFRSYFQDIFNYPYLINIDKINIKPYENDKRILIANVTINLYSEKTEAQKEAAKQAAANAKDNEEVTADQLGGIGQGGTPQ